MDTQTPNIYIYIQIRVRMFTYVHLYLIEKKEITRYFDIYNNKFLSYFLLYILRLLKIN